MATETPNTPIDPTNTPIEKTAGANVRKTWEWRPKLRWFASEIVVVVAGILIALSVNAWWAARTQQQSLREALVAVNEDFQASRQELENVLSANRTYVRGVDALLVLDEAGLAALGPDSVASFIGLLPTGGLTFDPTMGAVEALISGGDVSLIEDVALRTAIAAWPSVVDELTEDHAILIDMYMAQQERSVELGIYATLRRAELEGGDDRTSRSVLRQVINDGEMLNRLSAHAEAIEGLGLELVDAEARIRRVLTLLDQALSNK